MIRLRRHRHGGRRPGARRLFLRYALNNVLILALPLLVATVYYSVSIAALRDGIDSFAEAQLQQTVAVVDREFRQLEQMVTRVGNDYQVNSLLSNDGRFTDIEYYNLRGISSLLSPYVFGSPIISNILLYLHRSGALISESGYGYYDDYYGTMLSVEGYTARAWRSSFLLSLRQTEFVPSVRIRMHGNSFDAHLYRAAIGYGDYYLGSIVVVMSAADLEGLLADTPEQYGGWVHVATAGGETIASTDPEAVAVLDRLTPDAGRRSVKIDDGTLRVYHVVSAVNGWRYTAALNERTVFSRLLLVRTVAISMLAVGLVFGLAAAYGFAFRTSRPWKQLFDIVEADHYPEPASPVSAYDELEWAIDVMANRNRRLQAEIGAAEDLTRHYFFQSLLRGVYRSRMDFERARQEYGVSIPASGLYVIVGRITPINAVRGDDAYRLVREMLVSAIDSARGPLDHRVPISFDDVAMIRAVPAEGDHDLRRDATDLIAVIRAAVDPGHRGEYSFGVGTIVDDPFLLTISCNQAMSAATHHDDVHEAIRFYDQVSDSSVFYSYPLDVEEGLMRAVKSGNLDIVSQLLASLRRENFELRTLPDAELDHFFVELKGTALKLYNALPGTSAMLDQQFGEWWAAPPGPAKMRQFEAVCIELSKRFDGRKRSHNSALLTAIQDHIETHFADPEMSLTTIAEAFSRSENYLSSFYREQTGTRLSDAIVKIRMDCAAGMLAGEFGAIDRVAERCGYTSAASFRRAFKRVHGVSPSDFRSRSGS